MLSPLKSRESLEDGTAARVCGEHAHSLLDKSIGLRDQSGRGRSIFRCDRRSDAVSEGARAGQVVVREFRGQFPELRKYRRPLSAFLHGMRQLDEKAVSQQRLPRGAA